MIERPAESRLAPSGGRIGPGRLSTTPSGWGPLVATAASTRLDTGRRAHRAPRQDGPLGSQAGVASTSLGARAKWLMTSRKAVWCLQAAGQALAHGLPFRFFGKVARDRATSGWRRAG